MLARLTSIGMPGSLGFGFRRQGNMTGPGFLYAELVTILCEMEVSVDKSTFGAKWIPSLWHKITFSTFGVVTAR